MYTNQSKVIQEGKEGVRQIEAYVIKVNGVEQEREIVSEKVIKEPVNKIVVTKTPVTRGSGRLKWSDKRKDHFQVWTSLGGCTRGLTSPIPKEPRFMRPIGQGYFLGLAGWIWQSGKNRPWRRDGYLLCPYEQKSSFQGQLSFKRTIDRLYRQYG